MREVKLFQKSLERQIAKSQIVSAFAGSDTLLRIVSSLLVTFDVSEEDVAKVLGDLYDKYLEPIDLPYIPNQLVEPMVDAQLKNALVASGRTLYQRLKEIENE